MDKILELIDILIPIATGLGGILLGGYINRKNQEDLLEHQLKSDKQKEKIEILKDTLSVYNRVLKIDGEYMIINPNGGHNYEIEIDMYMEKIRPILYEKYHLLHSNVAKLVREMDLVIQECNYNEEVRDVHNAILMRNYSSMVDNIRKHIYDFRTDK